MNRIGLSNLNFILTKVDDTKSPSLVQRFVSKLLGGLPYLKIIIAVLPSGVIESAALFYDELQV